MAAKKPITNIGVVFGAMTIGKPGHDAVRLTKHSDTTALLDIFQSHGHNEVDTARVYGGGTTEEYLGAADWQARNILMETKLYPTAGKGLTHILGEDFTHSAADVRRGLQDSLNALKASKVHMFYLHGPDRSTPFEETLREVNALHNEGLFERFGLSNFQSWEVAQMSELCIRNGWIRPSVYQGVYNAQNRVVEAELVPCLRHYGIKLYVFNPLAGGFLTDRYKALKADVEKGSRFDPDTVQGRVVRGRYWNEQNFAALELLRPVVAKHGISEAEAALRWLAHHSALKKEYGDAIIVGASSAKHLEDNLTALEQGPLPQDVVEALDAGWALTRALPLKYWH